VIFGPKPRDYSQKMNRKERRLALRTAFQGRLDDLVVVENFASQLSQPKTKDLLAALARWDVDASQKVLLIVADQDENVWLSARNVQSLRLILATNLNVFDLLNADKVVVTADALEKIKEVYGDD
jgi:large subunit ribosomal protein L4